MRICYIHQYFVTPEEGGATRSYHLAKGLASAGHQVVMITSHDKSYYDFQIIAGIHVHYLPVAYAQEFGFLKRIRAFMSFVSQAKKLLLKIGRPDLLYISSTPLTTGWIGLWAKKKLAVPFIFEVRDLWPEAPIQVGVLKNPIVIRYFRSLEKNIYTQAMRLVALSPGIYRGIREVSPNEKIHLIPNFSDTDFFEPFPNKSSEILNKLGLKKTFTIAYTGAIGKINAVNELLILAEHAQKETRDFQFVIMGKGSHLDGLKNQANEKDLQNLIFLPFGNKAKVKELLSISDMVAVTFTHLPVLETNSPNKFFDGLAAGKAILVNHQGWVQQLVEQFDLGVFFDISDPIKALNAIQKLADDSKRLQQCQVNARQLAEDYFSKEMAVQKLLEVIDPDFDGGAAKDGVYILTA